MVLSLDSGVLRHLGSPALREFLGSFHFLASGAKTLFGPGEWRKHSLAGSQEREASSLVLSPVCKLDSPGELQQLPLPSLLCRPTKSGFVRVGPRHLYFLNSPGNSVKPCLRIRTILSFQGMFGRCLEMFLVFGCPNQRWRCLARGQGCW